MSTLNTQHPCDGIGCIQRASWKCECWTLHVKPKQAVTYWCDKHAEELKAEQKDVNSIWYRLDESPQPTDHQKQREEIAEKYFPDVPRDTWNQKRMAVLALADLDQLRQSEIERLRNRIEEIPHLRRDLAEAKYNLQDVPDLILELERVRAELSQTKEELARVKDIMAQVALAPKHSWVWLPQIIKALGLTPPAQPEN